jgi:hypothetical protein
VAGIVEIDNRVDGSWHMALADNDDGPYEVDIRLFVGGLIGLRDKADHRQPYLVLTGSQWRSFLDRIKRGELDHIKPRR